MYDLVSLRESLFVLKLITLCGCGSAHAVSYYGVPVGTVVEGNRDNGI
jgi:hypothetical protein